MVLRKNKTLKKKGGDSMNKRLIDILEEIGFVNDRGQHVYGSAAILHYAYEPISWVDSSVIELGKRFVNDHLNN